MSADDRLAEFLAAVERIRRERQGGIDDATRKKIAQELGWSEEDLRAARAAGEAKLEKGRSFLQHGLNREALASLQEAEVLLPDDPRVLFLIADCYVRLRRVSLARSTALRCIELDARHDAAFALLAELERQGKRRARWLRIGIVVLGGAMLLAQKVFTSRALTPPASLPVVEHAPQPKPQKATSKHWNGTKLACASTSASGCSLPLTPKPEGDFGAARLWFDDHASGLFSEYDGPKVHIAGRIEVGAGSEIEEVTADLLQLDPNGDEIDRIPLRVFPSYEPRLRAGDSHVFYATERARPGVDALKIVPQTVRISAAPKHYEATKKLDVTLRDGLPAHFSVQVGLQSSELKVYDPESSLSGVIEVTNLGPNPIRALAMSVECLDPSGKVAGASSETIAYHHMPEMRANDRRKAAFSCYVRSKLQPIPRIRITEVN